MKRTAPRLTSVVVTVLVLAATAVLVALTWQARERSEQRLLDRQLDQVGSLLTNQASVLEVQLANIGLVAVRTGGDPEIFAAFAAEELQQTGQSLSLWRLTDGDPEQLALQGVEPILPDGPAVFRDAEPTGELLIFGIVPSEPDRLAYGLMPAGRGNTDLFLYAESPLPPDRRLPVTEDSPVAGLDIAMYLGETTGPAQLLQATAPTPIGGDARTTTVPFGNEMLTIVGSSPTPLTGELAAVLPWIVLAVGLVLAVGGGIVVEVLSRRRIVAERLAAENARLYREQQSIAGTLQHALLPTVPALHGVEVAARYEAGADELAVGGDWYDVIETGPDCCVFVVGDVSGHGLPAATTMAALRFAVRGYLAEGHDIAAVLTQLRRLLDVDTDHQFATVLLGELDVRAGRLRLVSAGHFSPLLVSDGGARLLDCPPEPPVGVDHTGTPRVTEVQVTGPATLVAFTDGLVERRGEPIDAGLDRLAAAGTEAAERELPAMLDDVMRTLSVEGRKDDTVILGLRWTR